MLARYSLLIAYFVSLQVLAQVDDEFRAIAAEPTTLNAVLRSSAQHFPSIQAAQATIAEREGNALAAEGVFDPMVSTLDRARAVQGMQDERSADIDAATEAAGP